MSREAQDKFMLRLPAGMRQAVKNEANRNYRSMNAEIVFQLKRSYENANDEKADAQRAS